MKGLAEHGVVVLVTISDRDGLTRWSCLVCDEPVAFNRIRHGRAYFRHYKKRGQWHPGARMSRYLAGRLSERNFAQTPTRGRPASDRLRRRARFAVPVAHLGRSEEGSLSDAEST